MTDINKKLAEALANVPNFITNEVAIVPRKNGQQSQYRYLNLNTILTKTKQIFQQTGLTLQQSVNFAYNPAGGSNALQVGTVVTIVFDDTERLEIGSYPFVVTGDPQANGSAVTYARRYALYAILGVYPEKDDDGAQASEYAQAPKDGIDKETANDLYKQAQSIGVDFMQLASSVHGSQIRRMSEITKTEAQQLTAKLHEMKAHQS